MEKLLLSKLTLVVPSYNRQDYILRNMRYWSGRGPTVHVIDGSAVAIQPVQLQGMAENVHYHHLPMSMYDRFRYSIDLIETDYCALLGDDEFFLPSALEACIKELELEPKLGSCIGRCLGFRKSFRGVAGKVTYPAMENYSILQEDPVVRMFSHMEQPYVSSILYSVVRTPVWKRSMMILVEKEFPAYAIGELQFELAGSFQGKSKVIPELMWMRCFDAPPIRGTDPSLKPEDTFQNWWISPMNEVERSEFLRIMGASLSTAENDATAVSIAVKTTLDAFVLSISNAQTVGSLQLIRRKLISYIPPSLQDLLRYILKFDFPLLSVAREMADTGVKVDFEELSNIEAIVASSHAAKIK
jgi:glycosyltransferase domain-containing protein